MIMITLIPNPNPDIRILLHTGDDEPYLTVEESDRDAIGAPQWLLKDNGSVERVRAAALLALIDHFYPGAARAAAANERATALGCCTIAGRRYRCTVENATDYTGQGGAVAIAIEREGRDASGAPRWDRASTQRLGPLASPYTGWFDPDYLVFCLAPAVPLTKITVSPGMPTAHNVPDGIDHEVTVRSRGQEISGGITLVDGRPYGNTLDHWIGGPLERWLRDLSRDDRQTVIAALLAGEGTREVEIS